MPLSDDEQLKLKRYEELYTLARETYAAELQRVTEHTKAATEERFKSGHSG